MRQAFRKYCVDGLLNLVGRFASPECDSWAAAMVALRNCTLESPVTSDFPSVPLPLETLDGFRYLETNR